MIIKKQKTIIELEEDEVATLRKASEILEDICDEFGYCDECPLENCCTRAPSPSTHIDNWLFALT